MKLQRLDTLVAGTRFREPKTGATGVVLSSRPFTCSVTANRRTTTLWSPRRVARWRVEVLA
jgi:hypothetical protein